MTQQLIGGNVWRQHLADAGQAMRSIRREVECLSKMQNTPRSNEHLVVILVKLGDLSDALAALSSIGQAVRQ